MRTNLFNLKKVKKDRIVLEEETIDNPFLLFFKKYGKYLLLVIMLLAIVALIMGIYFSVKNLSDTTKVVTNISSVVVEFDGTDSINTINMKPLSGGVADKLFYERYGNIGLTEGVIFVVKEVKSKNGIVTYYSDGTSKLEKYDGSIVRISSLENGEYGINDNGVITIGAKSKEISISDTKILQDGTKIIYYSDNSCSIIIPSEKVNMLVRNSDRVVIENGRLKIIDPSGISKVEENDKINNISITYYEDGTVKIVKNGKVYIARNKEDLKIDNGISFPNNNEATVLKEISLKDGSKLIYYTDGSAEIVKANESIMVRKSKDIIYNEEMVIEIVETKYSHEVFSKITNDNREVKYLDNAGGLIKNSNGTYEYVYENSEIKYDEDGNIKDITITVKEKDHKLTPKGIVVIDLEDGKSIIADENGYLIVDTDKIIYDSDGNIAKIIGEDEINEGDIESSVSDNHFVINNVSGNKIRYMITIEISDNYKEYAPIWLDPKFLKFNIVENSRYLKNQSFGSKKLEIGTVLEGGTKIEKETYVLYESTLENDKKADISLWLWLDYTDITNEYQNSVFVGTIKVYTETIKE